MTKKLKVTPLADGGAVIRIPKGYLGQCHCGKEAKHSKRVKLSKPIPGGPSLGMPDITGYTVFVCDDHQ